MEACKGIPLLFQGKDHLLRLIMTIVHTSTDTDLVGRQKTDRFLVASCHNGDQLDRIDHDTIVPVTHEVTINASNAQNRSTIKSKRNGAPSFFPAQMLDLYNNWCIQQYSTWKSQINQLIPHQLGRRFVIVEALGSRAEDAAGDHLARLRVPCGYPHKRCGEIHHGYKPHWNNG